ncbi:MAG: protein-disulfide reductase DsbD family protein [Planctomycetota bacterium]|jgi:thiol:disulfide interchange protein DsbD
MRFVAFILVLASVLGTGPAGAQLGQTSLFPGTSAEREPEVVVGAVASSERVSPGGQLVVAVTMDFADGWHAWPSVEQDVLPEGFEFAIRTDASIADVPGWVSMVGPVQWPELHDARVPNLANLGTDGPQTIEVPTYSGSARLYIPILIDADAPLGAHELRVSVAYQACDETQCLMPMDEVYTLPIEIVALGEATDSSAVDAGVFAGFDASIFPGMLAGEIVAPSELLNFDLFGVVAFDLDPSGGLGLALLVLVAMLGGFLLNLTPCVLPVIPLKIMGLSQSAGHKGRTFFLGCVMSVGVVGFWMAIGGAIAFISGFDAISTLFQTPFFAAAVGLFIAIMGVGMLGVFTVRLPKFVYAINPSHESVHGSLLFGVMTAILSTPCTAPFMGTAAAWSTLQNPAIVLLVFGAIGAGMALPYFVLSANPKWVESVPRTGPSSELIKQVMGLLMLGVASFFLGTGIMPLLTEPGHSPSQVYWWLVAVFVVIGSGWLIWKTFAITRRFVPRAVFGLIGAILALSSVLVARDLTAPAPIEWVYYSPEEFEARSARGEVIVLDFTADWCLNCKALERAVLYSDEVVALMQSEGVVAMKIDLSTGNSDGQAKLREVGRLTIPLLAIFGPGLDEPWLSDSYSIEQVVDAVGRASDGALASR